MQNYFFTFGQNHYTNEGVAMRDYWVRVEAKSYKEARESFINNFTSIYMSDIDKFAFQYSEKQFDSSWFVNGEYAFINSNEEIEILV